MARKRRVELPVVSCDDCGACCETIGMPPSFWHDAYPSGIPPKRSQWSRPDWEIWDAMPEALRREVFDYYADLDSDRTADRVLEGLPCLWYDEQTRRCRQYEFRPTACRDFEVGGEDCRRIRRKAGVG